MNCLIEKERFVNEAFDIILLIGQSNAEGFGLGDVENPYEPIEKIMQLTNTSPVFLEVTPEDDKILHMKSPDTYRIDLAKETVHEERGILGCFALPFAKKYYEKYLSDTDRKVLLIRAAVGSSGFLRGNWCLGEPLYKRAVEMTDIALSLNPENRLTAILWHQGESDAMEGRRRDGYDFLYPYYMEKFGLLINDLRQRYGKVPFVAGALCRDWTPGIQETSCAVEEATKKVIKEVGCAAFAESEGLLSNNASVGNGDSIHFSRPSQYDFADRYFSLYEDLR